MFYSLGCNGRSPIIMSESSGPPPSKKRRRAITDAEKKLLRDWAHDESNGKPSIKACIKWFEENHYRTLSASTVSEITSGRINRYARMDAPKLDNAQGTKSRVCLWPELESSLQEWQLRMVRGGATITGDILKEMARVFWDKLPMYRDLPVPKFSSGWLEGFKQRHHIKRRMKHGEASSVDIIQVEEELVELRKTLAPYAPQDKYNMDESALYWKASPDRTLASEDLSGTKKEKARITANFCCNADGSDKLPPWFIGTAKRLRCFQQARIRPENLGIMWRSNKKAWMTSDMFKEYLHWFDERMVDRKVVLLIDNFSAHELGLAKVQETGELRNTEVIFLPANATSICQPLDQGIIRTWKAYYRRRWLRYVIEEYEADRDPVKTMNVLHAIRWSLSAWENDVGKESIERCWLKSRVLAPKYGPRNRGEDVEEVERLYASNVTAQRLDLQNVVSGIQASLGTLEAAGKIRKAMDIHRFIDMPEENVDDDDDDLVEQIVGRYGEDREAETDEEEDIKEPVGYTRAMEALETLKLYEEQQDAGDLKLLEALKRHSKVMLKRRIDGAEQRVITSYFT